MKSQFAMSLRVSKDFAWEITARSFGFYLMAPNIFDSATKTFSRPLSAFLKLPGHTAATHLVYSVAVRHDVATESLVVDATLKQEQPQETTKNAPASCQDSIEEQLRRQVVRMFRLDVSLAPFHAAFPEAMQRGYGRTFRSPTFFEDVLKTMTGCNTSFGNTRMMNALMCEHFGTEGAFPTPEQIAASSAEQLRSLCRVGYRDERIFRFAKQVSSGEFDVGWFDVTFTAEKWGLDTIREPAHKTLLEEARARLRQIHGFGAFSGNNVLQLIGLFEHVPVDTESRKVVEKKAVVSAAKKKKAKASPRQLEDQVREQFASFAPYQFLVYWYELYDFGGRFGSPTGAQTALLLTPDEAKIVESNAVFAAALAEKRKRKCAATE